MLRYVQRDAVMRPFCMQKTEIAPVQRKRGGIESDMARKFAKSFYRSKEWQRVRAYVLMRDKYLCVQCGAPAEEVHHIIHLNPGNIWDTSISLNPDNLVCLCKTCHFAEHTKNKADGHRKTEDIIECDYIGFDENGIPIPPCQFEKIKAGETVGVDLSGTD